MAHISWIHGRPKMKSFITILLHLLLCVPENFAMESSSGIEEIEIKPISFSNKNDGIFTMVPFCALGREKIVEGRLCALTVSLKKGK